ncbi:MAG TPA: phosphotransferase [Chloroflexota bacterium]|nr:phosphotransferase [Chloroflexota bacterium]
MSELLDGVSDPGLATLATVLDPAELATYLLPVLPRRWGALREARVQVTKHYPAKRCTIAIALRTTSGWHDLIGKVYATDRSDVYRALDGIRQAGFGPDAAFSIPQPLVFVPALRLLLLEKVQGVAVKEIVLAGSERDRALAAQQCARWLTRFQSVAPRSGPLFDVRMHTAAVWARGLATLDGPLTDKARRLLEHVDAAAGALNESSMCAGHGSYSPSHVILTAGRTVTIDWDGYDVADPARDVARFIVALKRLALGRLGSIRALDAVADVFVQTYVGLGRPDVAARLPCYEAAICLQIASNMARRGQPHWQMKVQTMLDEGLRTLEQHA